ncbi:MAG TPA: hypothetical protein PK165_01950 [bacterium]|nr:hypothetical protein [bacterium]HOL49209.1 hypothetical protein [bacterium]HPO51579.1 hypothetical protein [bacterium]
MPKRPSLKGRGVDIFLGKSDQKEKKPVKEEKKGKATFYFPQKLLSELDEAWFILRRIDRKIKKSDIVQAALEISIQGLKEGKKENPLIEYFKKEK